MTLNKTLKNKLKIHSYSEVTLAPSKTYIEIRSIIKFDHSVPQDAIEDADTNNKIERAQKYNNV